MEKIIHFIWVGCPLPEFADRNIAEFRHLNPDYTIMVHGESVLLPRLRDRYDATEEFVSKSDLLRISALYRYGGWYFDCDYYPLQSISEICNGIPLPITQTVVTEQRWQKNKDLKTANGMIGIPCAPASFWHVLFEELEKIPFDEYGCVRYGPRLFTRLVDEHPNLFSIIPWEYIYPLGHADARIFYNELVETGEINNKLLTKYNGGVSPHVVHLWANGKAEIK